MAYITYPCVLAGAIPVSICLAFDERVVLIILVICDEVPLKLSSTLFTLATAKVELVEYSGT